MVGPPLLLLLSVLALLSGGSSVPLRPPASFDLDGPGGRPGPRLSGAVVAEGVKFLLSSAFSDFRLAVPKTI